MSDASQTTDDLAARIRDLLSEAAATLEPDASADGYLADDIDDDRREALGTLGTEAWTILSETDPASLLAALGLGGADDSGSVPAAILAGDPDDVAELRVLLSLSQLAPSEVDEDADEPDPESVDSFGADERDAVATIADLLDAAAETDDEEADGTERGAASATADDQGDGGDDRDEIASALQEALDAVRTDVDDVLDADGLDVDAAMEVVSETLGDGEADAESQADGADGGLADVAGDVVDEAGVRLDAALGADADGADGDDDRAADEAKSGRPDAGGDDDDGGPFGLGDGQDGLLGGPDDGDRKSVSGFARGTHSTIPSRDRPDMTGVRRYSTMPDR
ncbi:hypothetical protein [Halovivax limisalsi]|uniref:hypothetical protein n=1 Tax=Halovivax limisalsi TaxID=1453760 RepID=UPI001FFCE72E|nr:hypothetical protein [Halovivax limisalsi]